MNTIYGSSDQSIELKAGESITINVPTGSTGYYVKLPLQSDSGYTALNTGNNTLGPFMNVERFRIFCTAGLITYQSGPVNLPVSDAEKTAFQSTYNLVGFTPNPDGGNRVTAGGIALQSAAELIDAAPTLPSAGVKVLTAVIRNPLTDVARVNEPAEIRITLPDGWAPAVECIRVRDAAGVYVPWQWEPCRHARTDALIATHTSTNIKAGSCWVVVPNLPAGGSVQYTVEVWPTAQTQSFAAAITRTDVDANTIRFETSAWSATFAESWSRNLMAFVNKASGFDFFGETAAGLDFLYKPSNSGTSEYSGLTTGTRSQVGILQQERDNTTFGYGVVYRWYVARSRGSIDTGLHHDVWYRIYVNGRIDVKCIHKALSERPTTDLKLIASVIKPSHAGGTHAGSNTGLWLKCDYGANGKLLVQARSSKTNSDADGTVGGAGWPGGDAYYTANPVRLRFGSQAANYVMPINAERREYFSLMISDDFDADQLKIWNPLVTTAAKTGSVTTQLQRFGGQVRSFLQRYSAFSSADADDWKSAMVAGAWAAYGRSGGYDQWSLVPVRIAQWLAVPGRGPADGGLGARLFANYKAGAASSGWEHAGRDVGAFYALLLEAQRRGDASVASLCGTIIRGIADHAVLCEADNGGTGRIRLNFTDGSDNTNLNATAEAVMALAFARAIGYAPAPDVALRTWGALIAGIEYRNWPPYEFSVAGAPDRSITYQVLSYFHRVMLAVNIVPPLLGVSTVVDPAYSLMASTNAQGQADEHRDNMNFLRRGSGATIMHFAANLAMYGNISEIEQAIQIMAHVNAESLATEPSPYPIDGWGNTSSRSVGDALCAMLALYPIRRMTQI